VGSIPRVSHSWFQELRPFCGSDVKSLMNVNYQIRITDDNWKRIHCSLIWPTISRQPSLIGGRLLLFTNMLFSVSEVHSVSCTHDSIHSISACEIIIDRSFFPAHNVIWSQFLNSVYANLVGFHSDSKGMTQYGLETGGLRNASLYTSRKPI